MEKFKKVVSFVLVAGVLAGAGYGVHQMIKNWEAKEPTIEQEAPEEEKRKQIKEETDNKVEEELPVAHPDDIVVEKDNGAVDLESTQELKDYATIVKTMRTRFNSKCFYSEALKSIDALSRDRFGNIEFRVTVLKKLDNEYITYQDLITIQDSSSVSIENLNDILEMVSQEELAFTREIKYGDGIRDENILHIYENYILQNDYLKACQKNNWSIELLDYYTKAYDKSPNEYIFELIIQNSDGEKKYIRANYGSFNITGYYDYEEWLEYAKKTNNTENIIIHDFKIGTELYPKWIDIAEDYNEYISAKEQGATSESSAASAFETEDGFDYPAYIAAKAENEAKKAKSASDETVLVAGENGRISINNSDLTF